ncbi:PRAME family member 12-like, partial [Sigmodon hispidus]
MSIQTTPTLEELARQALLRNEALAISALEDLPTMLFPVLFKDAFNGRHTRIVKAMVAAWPFPCLPVGALMKTFNREIFQAVLDGLDVLLTQQVSPMRRKLQEIYFQWVHHEFWTGARTLDRQRSAETVSEKQALKPSPTRELGQRLKLITDLYFRFPLDEDEMSILQWARQRKDSILLCCVNLKIVSLSLPNVRRILTVFEPEHLEMLELSIDWSWCTLAQFAPYVSQMSNLHTLSLERIQKNRFRVDYISGIEGDFAKEFIAEFTRLHSLQHLSLNGIFFPHDHMKLLLG